MTQKCLHDPVRRWLNPSLLLSVALACPLAFAQQQSPAACADAGKTSFDVASIKPSEESSGHISFRTRADSLEAGATAFHLIEYAYKLHDYQISGGPGWLNTARWEVTAKVDTPPPDWANLSSDVRNTISRQRMSSLLAQRFAFRCHFETKELPVYNLVVGKSGLKIKTAPQDSATKGSYATSNNDGRIRMEGTGVTMDLFVTNLSQTMGRTVVDKTGLAGAYDFVLNYTSDTNTSPQVTDAQSGPAIFTALEEQLGLRLEPAKGPVPVLVVDAIEKPSEN